MIRVDTVVKIPYLKVFSSNLYISHNKLYPTVAAHQYIHIPCKNGFILEICKTKLGKRRIIKDKIADTINVELKTTLIYLAKVSRDTLKYLILTIPEVQRHITYPTTPTAV